MLSARTKREASETSTQIVPRPENSNRRAKLIGELSGFFFFQILFVSQTAALLKTA